MGTNTVYARNNPTPISFETLPTGRIVLHTTCCGTTASLVSLPDQNYGQCRGCHELTGLNWALTWDGLDDLVRAGYVTEQPEPIKPRTFVPDDDEDEELL